MSNTAGRTKPGILFAVTVIVATFTLSSACAGARRTEGSIRTETKQFVMTEIELQSRLMDFSDRFAATMKQSIEEFDRLAPTGDVRKLVLDEMVSAAYSGFTIAAESDPDAALLDMVVMVTLGRIIYEEVRRPELGPSIEPVLRGFESAERDIWSTLALVLDPEQQAELREIIGEWRRDMPGQLRFAFYRFDDFAGQRRQAALGKSGGGVLRALNLFGSVEGAVKQVENARLLAERGKFLLTRMPLLAGPFADLWLTQLMANPGAEEVIGNINRFADVAENLPARIAEHQFALLEESFRGIEAERTAALEQFFAGVARERQAAIDQFIEQEQQFTGVLTELHRTVTEANVLVASVDSLASRFDHGERAEERPNAERFDINEYRNAAAEVGETVAELNTLIVTLHELMNSDGGRQLLPTIDSTVDMAGEQGKSLIHSTFFYCCLMIVVWMIAYILARLFILYVSKRMNAG